MKRISEEWLKSAQDNLRVIEKIISDEGLTHMVAFHSQQCVEKSLKAIIEEYDVGMIRVHNLGRLFEIVRKHVEIDVDVILIEKLDKLYIDSRYPADFGLLPDGKPVIEDAEEFYDVAASVYKIVKTNLEKLSSEPINKSDLV